MGAGKSTVSRLLANQQGACIDLDVEYVNFMIVDGFDKALKEDGSIGFNKWELSGDTIGLLAKHFQDNGYSIVIHGRVNDMLIKGIEKYVAVHTMLVLLPSLDVAILRDKEREAELTMGEKWVREDYEYYANNALSRFVRIDTSDEQAYETVSRIKSLL